MADAVAVDLRHVKADFRYLDISYDHRGQRLLRLDQRDQFLLAVRLFADHEILE